MKYLLGFLGLFMGIGGMLNSDDSAITIAIIFSMTAIILDRLDSFKEQINKV